MAGMLHVDLEVESTDPNTAALLLRELADPQSGVRTQIVREQLLPGAFESSFLTQVAVSVTATLLSAFIKDKLLPALQKHAQRVKIGRQEILTLDLQHLEDAFRSESATGTSAGAGQDGSSHTS